MHLVRVQAHVQEKDHVQDRILVAALAVAQELDHAVAITRVLGIVVVQALTLVKHVEVVIA